MTRRVEGKPCKHCGETTRYLASRSCIYSWRHDHMTEAQLERQREAKRKYRRSAAGRAAKRRYAASEKGLAKMRAHRAKWVAEGRCCNCGKPRLSETLCWDCLNKKSFSGYKERGKEIGIA